MLRDGVVDVKPSGDGPFAPEVDEVEIACTPRGGEGVGEAFDPGMRCFEGELELLPPELLRRPIDSRFEVGLGLGDPKTSSFSTSPPPDFGLCWLGLSRLSPDGTRRTDRKGDFETYAFLSKPFKPTLDRGAFIALDDRASGESFSFVPDVFLSPSACLSIEACLLSLETRLVPLSAEPELDPLGVRDLLADRGWVTGRPIPMPKPIAAFGVGLTPVAFSGETPRARAGARRSCMTAFSLSMFASYTPAACCPCIVVGDLKGELDTSEFFETCLNELELRRGEAVSGTRRPAPALVGSGVCCGERMGEDAPSRLLMLSGDHPLADELMIELRDAAPGVVDVGCSRRRVPGDGAGMLPVWWTVRGVGDDMVGGAGVRAMEGGLSMMSVDILRWCWARDV